MLWCTFGHLNWYTCDFITLTNLGIRSSVRLYNCTKLMPEQAFLLCTFWRQVSAIIAKQCVPLSHWCAGAIIKRFKTCMNATIHPKEEAAHCNSAWFTSLGLPLFSQVAQKNLIICISLSYLCQFVACSLLGVGGDGDGGTPFFAADHAFFFFEMFPG